MEKNVRREDWESLKPTVYGWGINDVNYKISKVAHIDGFREVSWCPYYLDWKAMVSRSFDINLKNKNPTYKDCTVSEDWKYLSSFIKWVDSQPNRDWQNCVLDKDLLLNNNKKYSQETVMYINEKVNLFLLDSKASRGKHLIGVVKIKGNKNPYRARCSDPETGKLKHIGCYRTELEAHKAWQAKKHEYACMLAEEQEDPRVADALRQRYAPDKDWTKA